MTCRRTIDGTRAFRLRRSRPLLLGILLALAACSSPASQSSAPDEDVGAVSAGLLSTPCTLDSTGNLTLTVNYGEVAYIGSRAGGSSIANAVTAYGSVCRVGATNSITVLSQGGVPTSPEKVILDYSAGLFSLGATKVTLDTAPGVLSKLEVIAPTTGSNVALGASGLDLDARAARAGGAKLDVKLTWTNVAGGVTFQGTAGSDAFVADVAGLTATLPSSLSATWDTSAKLTTIVGAAYPGSLTVSGGAGNDVLAGGAGTNVLMGGAGDDTFPQSSQLHAETISGGDGWDVVDYSARTALQPVTVTLGIDGAVKCVTVASGGAGYAPNDVLTLVGAAPGSAVPATVKVTSVSSGAITGLSIVSAGAGYAVQNGAATTGGSGSGATVNILPNGVASIGLATAGLGYRVNDVLSITPSSGTPATVKVLTVGVTGSILTTSLLTPGGGFSTATYPYAGTGGPFSVSGGSGANASFTVTALLSGVDDGGAGEGDSVGGADGLGDNDVEVVIGGAGNDILDARQVQSDVVLEGAAGDDTLQGGAGRDDLCGGPGNDSLTYSGCSTSYGCSVATASGDFLSGSGGPGGGAHSGDFDTLDYSDAPNGVVVCLNPADTTCGGSGNPYGQTGATAGMYDAVNNTHLLACPSQRPFLIGCGSTIAAYTPGAGTVATPLASAAVHSAGAGFAVGDLVTVAGGASGHLAVAQVTSATGGGVSGLAVLNAGQGYALATGAAATALPPSTGSSLTVDVTVASAGDYTCASSPAAYAHVAPGAAERFDVANITGHPTMVNVMDCDGNGMTTAPVACTLIGGLAADTLQGTRYDDALYGNGSGDTVLTNGGSDFVDLKYVGGSALENLDCHNDPVTVLYQAGATLHCRGASDPLGTYGDTGDQCTAPSNSCSLAYLLPE